MLLSLVDVLLLECGALAKASAAVAVAAHATAGKGFLGAVAHVDGDLLPRAPDVIDGGLLMGERWLESGQPCAETVPRAAIGAVDADALHAPAAQPAGLLEVVHDVASYSVLLDSARPSRDRPHVPREALNNRRL